VWRHAHRVIAVSAGLRELALRTWPGGDIRVIGNGVDLDRFRPAAPGGRSRPAERLKAVVVAQLIERKGLQFLLDALAMMDAPALAGFDVHICGTGPYEQVLRARAASLARPEAVRFEGLLEHEALPDLLRSADVFVLPTLQEGLPLALLEAMACGLPPIATGVGGIPDVVRDGENGRLIAPGSAIEIKRALEECLGSAERRRSLGSAARRTAEGFGWPAVWRQYARALELPAAARGAAAP
jgi:glycosyltransferase involved in cell wall biosynthesis